MKSEQQNDDYETLRDWFATGVLVIFGIGLLLGFVVGRCDMAPINITVTSRGAK